VKRCSSQMDKSKILNLAAKSEMVKDQMPNLKSKLKFQR